MHPFKNSNYRSHWTPDTPRPTTAAHYGRDPQFTFSNEYDEAELEESEDEDVFAFLPPSTAEQQQQQQQQHQLHHQPQQLHHQHPPSSDNEPQSVTGSPPYPDSNPSTAPDSSQFQHYIQHVPAAYQRRHVPPTATTAATVTAAGTATTTSSREVHVDLPTASYRPRNSEGDPKSRPLSNQSLATPSMMEEDDSRAGSIKMEFDFDGIEDEDSPFPEVRASVSNIDDPDMPTLTIRMWFIGLILCMISSSANVFFNFRAPAPSVVPLALLLISYPVGKFFAFTLPITTYHLPRILGSAEFSLNPGPWNIKEHVLVFIMANVAVTIPYAMNAIVVIERYYFIQLDYWFNLVFVLGTQLTGFGLAGLCRRFLVWPASMVWPQNLVACTLLNTLHAEDDESSGGITRYKYFMILLCATFVWFFFPGFLFQALSIFSFVCWIVPDNVPVNQLFGVATGLGMSVITFDWAQIAWIPSPLMVPWWAQVHIFTGFVLFFWILTPILYYTNTWQLAHFPISANVPYDRFGHPYDVHRVLKSDDTFNLTAYQEYSPLYLPATYAVTYLLALALTTCIIVHTVLYHGRSLINGVKRIRVEPDDIHAKLMRNYPEVPDWWYMLSFVVFFGCMIIAVEIWHTTVPVWALVIAVLLPIIYVLPSGFIYAMTGQGISLNLLAQIIPGTVLPGNPLANMVFKAYAVQTLAEATSFVQDLKLGHYIKVPPRATFTVQSVATIMSAFIQVGVKQWLFAHVPGMCEPDQPSHLICPHNQVYFTASAVWGLIGPSRQFGSGSLYHPQLYALIVGAVLPLPFWLWQRRYPKSWIKFISTPVLLNGVSYIPPATGINYSSWFLVGFVFQYLVRRRRFPWWSKFNYITSAALDTGTVLAVVVVFFTLQFPKDGTIKVKWWGNEVFMNTADYKRTPFRKLGPEGIPMTTS